MLLRTCSNFRRFKISPVSSISVRNLTQSEASVALRPFYFAVHPDRFAKDPVIQSQNEKSLQIFNGYLSELFPEPLNARVKPVQISFSILQKETGEYQKVLIHLSGNDPQHIVRTALEKCKLSTDSLPKSSPKPSFSPSQSHWSDFYGSSAPNFNEHNYGPSSSFYGQEFMDDFGGVEFNMWMDMDDIGRKSRKKKSSRIRANDLFANLSKLREVAIKKAEVHQKTTEILEDDMEYLKRKTGVSNIIWEINWDIKYMRRAIKVVKQMLSSVPKDYQETIIYSLNKRKLIFGRGTYVTVDGSLQFGADDVPEKWMNLCLEAHQRRSKMKDLEDITNRVQNMLANTTLIIDPHKNLVKTVKELHTIYNKLGYRAKNDPQLQSLVSNTLIEIVSPYGELAIARDGILQIPSNVNFNLLKSFLLDFAPMSKKLHSTIQQEFERTDRLKRDCVQELNLASLTTDSGLDLGLVQKTIQRLISNGKIKSLVSGLSLHITTNNNVYVMNDGRISIPLDWV